MTVNWKRRIVRVASGDLEQQREVVLHGLVTGWMLDAQVPGIDDMVDLVFRRAQPMHARDAWT